MLRKLILLAITAAVAKKFFPPRGTGGQAPFPTSRRPPEGYQG